MAPMCRYCFSIEDRHYWAARLHRCLALKHTNGLTVACTHSHLLVSCVQNYRMGQDLIKDRTFSNNEQFFQHIFEVGRRYKVMNPDKMRGTYGKLLYMLMDSALPQVEELLEFSCVKCALSLGLLLCLLACCLLRRRPCAAVHADGRLLPHIEDLLELTCARCVLSG